MEWVKLGHVIAATLHQWRLR